MPTVHWHPRIKTPGNDITDVISGEFFPDDDRPSLPLVREALQNAIDAGRHVDRGGEPIRVRILLRTAEHAAPAEVASRWFGALWDHVTAEKNGLREAPALTEPCSFLVVEDFGTVGLTGDVHSDDIDGAQNNFVDFLRSDGRTRKSTGEQGSWGVGKNVFPRCSRINSYIAFTVRRDDNRQLVMGKSILKIRRVGDKQYQPPVYLASSWDDGQVPLPYEDPAIASQLRQDFGVTREEEPGLSLVMPWVYESLRGPEILEDIVSQFYYPILSGTLRVDLDLNGSTFSLSSSTILNTVRTTPGLETIRPHVELAAWVRSASPEDKVELVATSSPHEPQKWDSKMISDEVREAIKRKLERRERVWLQVPLAIRHKQQGNGAPIDTNFDVFLEHDDSEHPDTKPRFFREMLCINEVKRAAGAQRIRSLVVIDDTPVAELLRNAEPPNHSDWAAGTANFKGVYLHGNHVVTFVKTAVRSIMSFVRGGDDTPDASIAIEYFSKPRPSGATPSKKAGAGKKKGKDPDPPPPPPPPPSPKRFKLVEIDSGFKIVPGDEAAEPPKVVNVSMAYDVFAGSPWKQYEPADFDLTRKDKSGVTIATSGGAACEVTAANRLKLRVTAKPFELYVTGFDPNRDLIVSARAAEETSDGDSSDELHEED